MKDVKQVIVMRKDLNMRKGKMIAQGAHASMLAILIESKRGKDFYHLDFKEGSPMDTWINGSFKKITVYVNSHSELLELNKKRIEMGLPGSLITDSGLTEFKEPTDTCIAIGPALSEDIDKLTGDLPLL